MRGLFAVVSILVFVLPCAMAEVGKCLTNWGVVLGLRESVLNKALQERLILRVPAKARTITATHKDDRGWFPLLTRVENALVSDIQIHAIQTSMKVARLELYFSSGDVFVESGNRFENQSLVNKYLALRVTVKTTRSTRHGVNRYRLDLIVKDDNAIMASKDERSVYFAQLNDVMRETFERSLTLVLRSLLETGNGFGLLTFDVPIPNPSNISLISELIPQDVDAIFYNDERNARYNSFGVLMSPVDVHVSKQNEARQFTRHELVPTNADFAMTIDGQAIMSFIDDVISDQKIFSHIGNPLFVTNTCPARIMYYENEYLSVEEMSLTQFRVRRYSAEELEIYVELFKDEISEGVDLEAWATVRMALDYDTHERKFTPRITYEHQSHRTIKAWYTNAPNAVTFDWYSIIVDLMINDVIKVKIVNALAVSMSGADMPTNIGGILGEAIGRMQFAGTFIDEHGNFVFQLSEYN